MQRHKAQIAVEYLLIVGLSLGLLIPTSYLFYKYSQSSNEETVRNQVFQLGSNIITSAESVYGLSEGSMITSDFTYPSNVKDIYVLNERELVIVYDISSGRSEAVFFSKIKLSSPYNYSAFPRSQCTPQPCVNSSIGGDQPYAGIHKIRFESKSNYVMMTYVQ